ncbi:MAG: hypothetical protein SOZ80_08250 [Prevotella sp.]|uniref:YncE family protein n=1 Tax=Prevotella sp. TaxID=59823 RepID=UPI002A291BB4|nr:hypothetical protein [Prevotella sp.]MDD7317832.1 hypothetical protein [Prevotellaceae bacterium]MDY4020747.1 hypothetical protein [Prevotella sp.]
MRKILSSICLFLLTAVPAEMLGQEKIIILNEGNWQTDNGKITYFEDDHVVSNEWFREKNGYKLGDTPNDIIQVNDTLIAIAINWSNIVQFIRPDGTAVTATENVPNNRKLASDGRYVYISSYGHECETVNGMVAFTKGYVAKIDLNTFKVVAATEVGYEPEGIALYDGHLFVANTGGYAFQEPHDYETTVSILNAETMEVVKNIDTGIINLYGKMSQSGKYLCINSPGNYYEILPKSMVFDCEKALKGETPCFVEMPYAATYNTTTRDGKFYVIGSKYSYYTQEYTFNYKIIDPAEMIRTDGAVGVSEDFPGTLLDDLKQMGMPYAIYVNPYTGYIYATDAGSFTEAGALYQWSPEGVKLGRHKVYINPGHFLALPPNGIFTGVETVENEEQKADNSIYDLMGRKVEKPQRGGIYIRNGRKFVCK